MASEAILQSSERLSPNIYLHIFLIIGGDRISIKPSGHVDLQFSPDLHLIHGGQAFSQADRLLSFTPCSVKYDDESPRGLRLFILAKNGRLTQLMSMPRPQGPLTAQFMGSNGGFPLPVFEDSQRTLCIASGVGISPFLSLPTPGYEAHLMCTLNGSDFSMIEYSIAHEMLVPDNWSSLSIFITSGDEASDNIEGKPLKWWREKISDLFPQLLEKRANIAVHFRRMSQNDVDNIMLGEKCKVLFCGSKAMEWQIKMWTLGKATVHTAG